ncbi:MAG: purine-nucleoside phosphorylase [Bacilli bacterium]|nr:purine-nucleoside phosphorylase [Bacilli bacterium]
MSTAHIESKLEDIAPIVLMPGDPLRAKYIAENFLENAKLVNEVRNMYGYTGTYKGKKVTVFASGMGIPSIGIYAYELFKFYNVEKIIRVGSCGSFNKNIKLLDVVLSKGAYSKTDFDFLLDGNDKVFVLANEKLNNKIIDIAEINNINIKYGNTITSEVFDLYCDDPEKFRSNFPDMNFLAVEMEAYALFYLAEKFNRQAACLMTVVDSLYDKKSISSEERETSLNDMIKLALESII